MSKAGKIPEKAFLFSPGNSFRRVVGKRPKRRFFLIVCEGEKTEPNYFEAIRLKLPKDMVSRVVIRGAGKNTLSLIEEVEAIIEQRRTQDLPPFYNVWIVMDRDSFPAEDFDNAIRKIEQHPEMPGAKKWFAAWSNEAFELWYILHYTEQTGGAIHREEYAEKLERFLGHPYVKNSLTMFQELQCRTLDAIRRAQHGHHLLQRQHLSFSRMNPATTVYQLVSELLRYMDSF